MILQELHNNQVKSSIMANHRHAYNKIKALVTERKFQLIDPKDVNKQKQIVILHLNNCAEDESMLIEFNQLSFYQERYRALEKFLLYQKDGKNIIDVKQANQLVKMFQEHFDVQKQGRLSQQNKYFKHTDSLQYEDKFEKQPNLLNANKKLNNAGLGEAVFEFFEKKQREAKRVGFKDLIQKDVISSTKPMPFKKKVNKPGHDLQIKKLLQQNKRLHSQLEKRSKQDVELNEFEKNVLREEKQRCMKRIEELEEEVEELAKNNYKLQQVERSRKGTTTFFNDSIQTAKHQYLPYYIPTRHNDLNKITEKNKIIKQGQDEKDQILMNLVSNIPPIQKKQQHSFDDELNKYQSNNKDQNYILEGLLEDQDEKPRRQIFTGPTQLKQPKKDLFYGGEELLYRTPNSRNSKPGEQIEHGSRFQSFSMAQTAYNNSSLFLNASKNMIAIDSVGSTRNKVAFFKNSLVIIKDSQFQIAFKRSDVDSTYSRVRLIFYINNKTDLNQTVHIDYEYESSYYTFQITQKLKFIYPNQQSRQVVQVSLAPQCPDLNSVVDVHFTIGQRKYDLWVPICFIVWTNDILVDKDQAGFLTVQPDRQFSSYENTFKILPLGRKIMAATDESQAYLYGRSRFGNHQIKLSWWQKELTIDAGNKVLDFLGFVMHHFK